MARTKYYGLIHVIALLLAAVGFLSHGIEASDADVILDFINKTTGPLPNGWSVSDIGNFCSWSGITCNTNNRITELRISAPTGLRGSFTPRLSELTMLTTLNADEVPFVGTFPEDVLALPNLYNFDLESSVEIKFPPALSPSLRTLRFSDVNYTAPLPSWIDFGQLSGLYILRTEIQCPLPQSLVARIINNTGFYCELVWTRLEVTPEGKVCGQIPLDQFNCDFWPIVTVPPSYNNESGAASNGVIPLHSVDYQNIRVEFGNDSAAAFFLTYRSGGRLVVYREEYTMLKFFPIVGSTYNETLIMTEFRNFQRVSDKILRMNATVMSPSLGAVFEIQWIWEFGVTRSNLQVGGVAIKFSMAIHNFRKLPSWARVKISFNSIYKVAHSPVDGPPLRCTIIFPTSDCRSPALSIRTEVDLFTGGGTMVKLNSSTVEFKFSYGLEGNLDGVPLADRLDLSLLSTQYYSSLGFSRLFTATIDNGREHLFRRPFLNQFTNFFLTITVPDFTNFYYDPDLQLRLLFDVSGEPSLAATVPSSGQAVEAINLGVAVGVSITVVVILALASAAAFVVVRNRREKLVQSRLRAALGRGEASSTDSTKTRTGSEPPAPVAAGRKGSSWKNGDKPQSLPM